MVCLLLARGAEIEAEGCREWTPLHKAAESGHEAMVRLLLDRGANIEAKDSDNLTPLQWAILARRQAVVRLLQGRGADATTDAEDRGKPAPPPPQPPQPTGDERQATVPPLSHETRSSEACGGRQWPGPSDMLGSPGERDWVFPSPGGANEANKRVKLDDERLV